MPLDGSRLFYKEDTRLNRYFHALLCFKRLFVVENNLCVVVLCKHRGNSSHIQAYKDKQACEGGLFGHNECFKITTKRQRGKVVSVC
jgi:hypothetical protein